MTRVLAAEERGEREFLLIWRLDKREAVAIVVKVFERG